MKQYYTDNEILELIENKKVTELVRERFEQKDNQRNWLQQRVNVAAEHIGHQTITDLLEEGY
jgi:chromosome condensin MukBEF MukE localization factor